MRDQRIIIFVFSFLFMLSVSTASAKDEKKENVVKKPVAASEAPKSSSDKKVSLEAKTANKDLSDSGGTPPGPVPFEEKTSKSAEKLSIDPTTGSATVDVSISVAPGRGGIQPTISLMYNSHGANGMLGMGWILELGAIQRSAKKGSPRYTNADTFVLVQPGSQQELVDISGNQTEFRPQIEGAFMKFEFVNNDHWVATDRKGIKYFFGTSADSQVVDPENSAHQYRWSLDRVEDIYGNYMTLSYMKDGNQLYPLEIQYTGNSAASLAPFAKVSFSYEQRPDVIINHLLAFKVTTAKRLMAVEVSADAHLIRKYVFQYDATSTTKNSRLIYVTQYGDDGKTSLPSTEFRYSKGRVDFWQPVTFANYPNVSIGSSNLVRLMDMNKDGFPDIIKTQSGINIPWQVYFNDGEGNFNPPQTIVNAPPRGTDNVDVRFFDFNGDGLLDVICGEGPPYSIWINDGSGSFLGPYVMDQQPAQSISITHQNLIQFFDMNRDGKADMVETQPGNNNPWKVYMNTGDFSNGVAHFNPAVNAQNSPIRGCDNTAIRFSDFSGDGLLDVIYGESNPYQMWINNGIDGFNPPTTISQYPGVSLFDLRLVQFIDMNADGLTDMVRTYSGISNPWDIYFNNGKGDFEPSVAATNPPERGMDNVDAKLVDMNGDGLVDVFWGQGSYVTKWKIWLNNGRTGFNEPTTISRYPTPNALDDPEIMLCDLNGDGLMDIVRGSGGAAYQYWPNASEYQVHRPDTLIMIYNQIGGRSVIAYGNQPVQGILGPQYRIAFSSALFHVVKSRTEDTFISGSYKTDYAYDEGLWNHPHREFRGFRVTKVKDADGNYSESYILQDDIFKGRPAQQRTCNAEGILYAKTQSTWNVEQLYPGVNFVYLEQKDDFIYNGQPEGKRTQEKYFYEESPQFGNLTKVIQLGEVDFNTGDDVGADSRTAETQYHNNTTTGHWLLGLPKETIVYDHSGAAVRKAWIYYDGHTDLNTLPTLGQMTMQKQWAGDAPGSVDPVMEYTYDAYGNLLTTKDPNGHETFVTYENNYFMFPIEVKNALGHVVQKEYYGINGVPLDDGAGYHGLWSQVKLVKDPNEQEGKKTYDALGRLVATVSPLDSIQFPTTSIEYNFGSYYAQVMTHQREISGQPWTIDTAKFYDSLGRLMQTKSRSGYANKTIVSGIVKYNQRGLPIEKYLPFFSANPITVFDYAPTGSPKTTLVYDAMGRVVKTINANGSYATAEYGIWNASMIDENGHKQTSYTDAYGRLIQRQEYFGADGRSDIYPQEPFFVYATTNYFYDSEGNLVQVEDAHGNVTTISYDPLGHKISMHDPDMGYWEYKYDPAGNLVWQRDAKGQELTFNYDALNRLVNKTDGSPILNVAYTYDQGFPAPPQNYSIGRLARSEYGVNDQTGFLYDLVGREIKSTKEIDSTKYDVLREYDAASRLAKLTYPDDGNVIYTYNIAGQIDGVGTTSGNSDVSYKADPGIAHKKNSLALTDKKSIPRKEKFDVSAVPSFASMQNENPAASSNPDSGETVGISVTPVQPVQLVRMDYTINLTWSGVGNGGQYKLFTILIEKDTGVYLAGAHNCGITPSGPWVGDSIDVTPGSGSATLVKDLEAYQILLGQVITNYMWIAELRLVTPGYTYDPNNHMTFSTVARMDINTTAGTSASVDIHVDPEMPHPAVIANYKFDVSWQDLPMNFGYDYKLFYILVENVTGYYFSGAQDPDTGIYWTGTDVDIDDTSPSGSYSGAKELIAYDTIWGGMPILGYDWIAQIRRVVPGKVYNSADPTTFITVAEDILHAKPGAGLRLSLSANYFRPILNYTKEYVIDLSWLDPIPTFDNTKYDYKYYVTILDADSRFPAAMDEDGGWWSTEGDILDGAPSTASIIKKLKVVNNDGGNTNTNRFAWVGELRRYPKGNTTDYIILSRIREEVFGKDLGSYVYVANVQYNAAGQIIEIEYGNNTKTFYRYDPKSLRLVNLLTLDDTGKAIQDFVYAYDEGGNIIAIDDRVNTASQKFTYDALSRLTRAEGKYGIKIFEYDEIGNIRTKGGVSYQYGENGAGPHAVTSLSNGTTFDYDANGNMMSIHRPGEEWAYVFDSENRLTEVLKNNNPVAKFEYDGDGGRVKKTIYGAKDAAGQNSDAKQGIFDLGRFSRNNKKAVDGLGGGETTTKYIGSLYDETSGVGGRYIFLGSMRVAEVRGGLVMYYLADHLGSTNLLADEKGLVKELCEYLPFGGFSRHEKFGGPQETAWFYFTGKPLDEETGLYYYGARYYNPLIGRFITPDFVVQTSANPQMLNRYSYCGNNPVNISDPTGHFWFFAAIAAIFKAASAYAVAHPIIAGAAMGGILGGVNSAINGTNIWQGIGLGILSGAVGGAVGLGVGDFLKGGVGNFWSGMAAAGAGGATAGAAASGVMGGDVGMGALSGLAGGIAGFLASYNVAPIAGDIVGSVASAAVSGGNIGDSALGGLMNGGISATIGMMLPDPTTGDQNPQPGDLIFNEGGVDPSGVALSYLQGSSKSHVAIVVGEGRQVDSHVNGGVKERDIRPGRQGRVVKWAGSGNQKFIALAVQYGKENNIKYWLGPNREICSTFVGRVAREAGLSVPGFSPSSQYNNIQGIQYRNTYTYGVQR